MNPLKYFKAGRNFYHTLFAVAIPIFLQSVITQGVQMADTIMLGRIGETALSGASLANTFINVFLTFCMGLGQGAAVITSQYWGKGETNPIRHMTSILIKIALLLSIIFTLLGVFIPERIMALYANEEDVIVAGAQYLQIIAAGAVFTGLTTAITSVLRSVGTVKLTLYTSLASFFVNIFFNYAMIFGELGFPRLEMRGAAYATVIARILEFSVIFGYLLFKDKDIGFRFRHLFGWDGELFKKYLKVGLPVLLSDGVMAIGYNLVSVVIGHMGKAFIAANSIVAVVNQAVSIASSSMSASASIIIGNTIGSEGMEKAYEHGKTFIALSLTIGVVSGTLLFFIKDFILGFYDLEPLTITYATQMLEVMCVLLVFRCLDSLLSKGVLRGGGDTRFLIIADTVFVWLVSAPMGYLAGLVFNFPVWAVYLCLNLDFVIKDFLVTWRFASKKWLKDVTV